MLRESWPGYQNKKAGYLFPGNPAISNKFETRGFPSLPGERFGLMMQKLFHYSGKLRSFKKYNNDISGLSFRSCMPIFDFRKD
jgi:hypothetical protein